MTSAQVDWWGLQRAPFGVALDPDLFYPSQDHAEALARLEYLCREGGTQLGLLTGEIGCGKSLIRSVFAHRAGGARRVAQLTSSHLPFSDLLRGVLVQLGVADAGPAASAYDLLQRLQESLEAQGVPAVLLFDEAQELDHESLVGVRALSNLADGHLSLTLVLVGQPELRQRVLTLPQLDQRAGLRFHLRPLRLTEVGEYVTFRLRGAGHPSGEVLSPNAVEALAAASRGVPREINRIARLAMAVAARAGAHQVDEPDVAVVVADLGRQRGGGAGP